MDLSSHKRLPRKRLLVNNSLPKLVNPNFFVMSDKHIRFAYGCSENELGYVNFMWRMKLLSEALIDEYSNARKVPKDKAFQKLALECQSAVTTMPKLIDEYNWVKYNH
jgi:hypothetical protein